MINKLTSPLLFISLITVFNNYAFSQDIRFVKEHGFRVGYGDGFSIGNFLVINDWIYYFTSTGTPHRGYRHNFHIANLKDSIEYPVYPSETNDPNIVILKNTYNTSAGSYYDFLSNNKSVYQYFIIIDDILYLRDTEDYSIQFTLDGEHLGSFPSFSEKYPEYADYIGDTLFIDNKSISYPYEAFDKQYNSFDTVGNTVLLVSKDRITSVNRDDLNNHGNEAIHRDFFKADINFNVNLDRNSVIPLINNLFILHEKSNGYIYQIEEDLSITQMQKIEIPTNITNNTKIFYPYLYQPIWPLSNEHLIQRYKIEGLKQTSDIPINLWNLYE